MVEWWWLIVAIFGIPALLAMAACAYLIAGFFRVKAHSKEQPWPRVPRFIAREIGKER
jgi:hypothetical protein